MSEKLSPLEQRLAKGTLLVQAVGLLLVWLFWPQQWVAYLGGAGLSWGYLTLLRLATQNPHPKLQGVLSVVRVVGMAYALVWMGQKSFLQTAVVIGGFLSYKIAWFSEYCRAGLQGIRRRDSV